MAVAEASFKIVKVSISLGWTVAKGFDIPLIPPSSTGTPSITINGLLDADIEEPPRTRIVAPAPGAPPSVITLTPAALPTNISVADVTAPFTILSALIAVTDPVKSFFLAVP